ncbi:MAG TPA: alpha/beta hydrolase [Patescibacteria group bacterium]|nr:alpha/beta hydrolase [Patescibacteria group bacterium]
MLILRARINKEIVCEFAPPVGRANGKAVIIASGAPTYPKCAFIEKFARLGYFCVVPRYRGSWESDGTFLQRSPEIDIQDTIAQFEKGFVSIWDGVHYRPRIKKIILVGSSFGGPAALLCSKHTKVSSVIAVSSVVDWPEIENGVENFTFTVRFFREAFGNGYRVAKYGWKRLYAGKFYNPATEIGKIDPKKIIFIHAKDDESVPYPAVKQFAHDLGAPIITLNKGGHLGTRVLFRKSILQKIKKYL